VLTLSGKTAIPLDQWAQLRVEIDGQQARLFVNDKPEATVKTMFRPCDVALPGAPQLSSLGNNRQKNSPLMGVLDELVIYSRVNADFASLSAPVVNCPIRPSQGALEAVTEYAKFVEAYNAKLKATKAPKDDSKADVGEFAEQLAYYKALKPRMQARLDELTMRDTTVAAAQAKLNIKEAEYEQRTKALREDVKEDPDYKRAAEKQGELRQKWDTGSRAWHAARQETMKSDELYQQLDAEVRKLQQKMHDEKPKRESRQWNEMRQSISKVGRKRHDRQRKVEAMLKTSDPRWVALFELQSRLRTGDR
jgi:hypothetical protein